MMSTGRHPRGAVWTVIVAALAAAWIGCQGDEDQVSTAVSSVEGSSLPPWACETHTTLADPSRIAPLSLDRLQSAAASILPGRQFGSGELDSLGITTSLVGAKPVSEADTALVWRSPQYHDCQDLIAVQEDSLRYTSRAGVMATVEAQLVTDADFTSDSTLGHRLLFVRHLAGGGYDNLLLPTDSACVYFGAGGDSITDPWWAEVRDCVGPTAPRGRDRTAELAVTRLTYPGHHFSFGAYPPVARWEWDDSLHVQEYGVKCGTGWCVAGVQTPIVDTTISYGSPMSPQAVIHGWRDEQFLADSTDSIPSRGRPSEVYAVIVPDRGLGSITLDGPNPKVAGFVQVTRGSNPADPGEYGAKYGFRGNGHYPVLLGGGVRESSNSSKPDTTGMRIAGLTNDTTVLDVAWNLLGATPVATARWAWSLSDEPQWWACPNGCCETIGPPR